MEDYSLEEFLNERFITIDIFLNHMDQTQINYKSLASYMMKVKPEDWVLNAFSFLFFDDYNWRQVSSDWFDKVQSVKHSTQILFFNRKPNKTRFKKIEVNFE
jgi:hypothetical protein